MSEQVISEFKKNSAEIVRVSRKLYKGKLVFDFRVLRRGDDGAWQPTRKGLCVQAEAIPHLKRAITDIESIMGPEASRAGGPVATPPASQPVRQPVAPNEPTPEEVEAQLNRMEAQWNRMRIRRSPPAEPY